jgi:hypothetical protein
MIKIFVKAIVCWALMSNSCFAQSSSHPFIPKTGKLLIIGQQRDSIDGYIKSIGIVPGGFMFYTSIQKMEGLDKPVDEGAGIVDVRHYVKHYPHIVIQLGLYMVGALDDTLAGKYDGNILKLAKWMKNVKRPIYFRIGYEFDLPSNRYDPQQYKQAYRYIVDHLRAQGVNNVAYVWHSASMMEPYGIFMDWYPGDDYVDWFAVSIFNSMQIWTAKRFFTIARQHQKPVMIAESTPAGLVSTHAKKDWFRHYFDFIHSDDIKIVCYINSNWDTEALFHSMHWGDERIEQDPEIKKIWINEIKNGYLESSPDLFNQLNGLAND